MNSPSIGTGSRRHIVLSPRPDNSGDAECAQSADCCLLNCTGVPFIDCLQAGTDYILSQIGIRTLETGCCCAIPSGKLNC